VLDGLGKKTSSLLVDTLSIEAFISSFQSKYSKLQEELLLTSEFVSFLVLDRCF
jgi:hypothetical protein